MPTQIRHFPLLLRFAFCVLSFAFFLLTACSEPEDPNTLYIVSPHASDIRLEFSKAFSAWHKKNYGTEVTVKWPDHGGTQDIINYLGQQYDIRKETCGYDLFFGGGSNAFNGEMNKGHFAVPANLDAILKNMPEDSKLVTFKGLQIDPKTKLPVNKDPQWFAATMSNFGIAINKLRIKELGLKTPVEWNDLAAPEWFGQLSLADPSKSGSVLTAYEFVLDQYSWEPGWRDLSYMFANADSVKDGGSNPAEETDLGNTAAGVVIDFFARNHVAKLGDKVMGFVIPKDGAILDADPIAVLKGAPHHELASRFVEFVTSPEGQKLWVMKPKTPGGPQFKSLGRLSIHRSLYTDPALAANLFDPTDPFAASVVIQTDPAIKGPRRAFLGHLMKCAFVDNHAQLTAARAAINKLRKTNPERAAELDLKLSALPPITARLLAPNDLESNMLPAGDEPLTAAMFQKIADKFFPRNNPSESLQNQIKDYWRNSFRARYEKILIEAGS